MCYRSRLVLLLLVILANHATFVVEQPRQSLLYRHFRWDWFVNQVAKAARFLCDALFKLHLPSLQVRQVWILYAILGVHA